MSLSCLVSNTPHVLVNRVVADRFIRKMNGGTQSSLVSASDGNFYVLKFAGNPQGPNTLFNEALGSILAQYLGLPTPEWRPIEVTTNFIQRNSGLDFHLAAGGYSPNPGLHFGSRFVTGSSHEEVYEVVPHRWIERITDPDLFVGMLLLDIWTQNTDRRQALFIEGPGTRALDVIFFDHGHMFGGPTGEKGLKDPRACLYYHRNVYKRALGSGKSPENWISRIEAIDETILRALVEHVPRKWRSRALMSETIKLLTRRRKTLRQQANEAVRTLFDHGEADTGYR